MKRSHGNVRWWPTEGMLPPGYTCFVRTDLQNMVYSHAVVFWSPSHHIQRAFFDTLDEAVVFAKAKVEELRLDYVRRILKS